MITVKINGENFPTDSSAATTMADLVEYVKATIDPDTIITDISLAGQGLSDVDWRLPLSAHATKTLEVKTGTKEEYLSERFATAPALTDCIKEEFNVCAAYFTNDRIEDANNMLKTAVTDLQAFIGWYNSLIVMLQGTGWEDKAEFFEARITDVSAGCEQILQQQLYNSWWALAETIQDTLVPNLTELGEACKEFSDSWK